MDKSISRSKSNTSNKNVKIENTGNTGNLPTVINKNKNVIVNDEELFGTSKARGRKSNKTSNNDLFGLTTTITNQNSSSNQNSTNLEGGGGGGGVSGAKSGTNIKSKYVSKKIIKKPVINDEEGEDDVEDMADVENVDDIEENAFKKNGYTRPDITYTDQLSKDQIEKKLEDYKKVDDIYKVPLGVHLRYFSNIDGKMVFRMGGQLHKNTGLPAYIILTNGKNQWSVQVKDTIFYRKMVLQEIKDEYENIINGLLEKNKKLKEKLANK